MPRNTIITSEDWASYCALAEGRDPDPTGYAAECEAEARAEQQADEALERRYEEMGAPEPPEDLTGDPFFNGEYA